MVTMRAAVGSDSELLNCFVKERDSAAFRDLVVKHGPAVLQVCRAVLRDTHDADDAFQATFMVLVHKAPSIEDPQALGSWLRGVAHRTALRARCRAARRRVLEKNAAGTSDAVVPPDEPSSEIRQIMREELDRLPEHYRHPLTLCYLEGLTNQEAARRLGWPVGTVKVRLVRGRRILRDRLDRRGAGLGAGLLLWLLNPGKASAVPERLVDSTVQAMNLTAAGRHAALKARFAGPLRMAAPDSRPWLGRGGPWLWMVIAVLAIVLGLTGGSAALSFYDPLKPDIDPATLPANLTDIRFVECG